MKNPDDLNPFDDEDEQFDALAKGIWRVVDEFRADGYLRVDE